MTQVYKGRAATPRLASRRRERIDDELDPVLFKALSDPTRVSLLACIAKCGRGCSVTEVAACCSVDMSVVSRHLGVLADAGILESTKTGRHVKYRVRYADLSRSLRSLADAVELCCPEGDCDCGDGCDCC